eukprot:14403038-Alexandrium_andersonii.AAC.1
MTPACPLFAKLKARRARFTICSEPPPAVLAPGAPGRDGAVVVVVDHDDLGAGGQALAVLGAADGSHVGAGDAALLALLLAPAELEL